MKPQMLPLGATQAADIAGGTVMEVTPDPFAVPVVDAPVAGDDVDILVEEMMAGVPDALPSSPEDPGDDVANLSEFPTGGSDPQLSDLIPMKAQDAAEDSGHAPGDTPGFLAELLDIF